MSNIETYFSSLSRAERKEISRKGGKSAHAKGRAYKFTPDKAREAGTKGGQTVSANREHMSHIGRIGGKTKRSKPTMTPNSAG